MERSAFLVHLCFSFCLSVSVLLPNAYVHGQNCTSVKRNVGQCIEIEKCPSIYSLSQQRPLSEESELFLRLSWCDESKVCCDYNKDDDDDIEFGDELLPHPLNSRYQGSEPSTKPKSCNTIEGQKGNCVSIGKCPRLRSLLDARPFTAQTQTYLRRANCGFEGKVPKVCCPMDVPTAKPHTRSIESDLLPNTTICGFSPTDRISGGTAAVLSEFPWMALLKYRTAKGNRFMCGGSLINNKYVLTAAHCVKGKDLRPNDSLVSIRLGEHNIRNFRDCDPSGFCAESPIEVKIAETIVHEGYDPHSASQHHDIALLRLVNEVPFTLHVAPICIPTTIDLLSKTYIGMNLTVAGWGVTEHRVSSDVLRKVEVKVKNIGECSQVYNADVNLAPSQICAGGDANKDSCRGDSGGPLMVDEGANFYAAGIVSFGPVPCGTSGYPGVYTRLSDYVEWIVKNLKP